MTDSHENRTASAGPGSPDDPTLDPNAAPTAGAPAPGAERAELEPDAPFALIAEGPGDRIGPYELRQVIGEGGFGSVFLAEQTEPLKRQVAVKVIKLGMDTRQVIARFEAERQALAIMDHPNIAKVLDAGATDSGRPYFVMELVKGEPIVAYCDRNTLPIADRLRLFEQACAAVQHAHTKGIIHRDIKPSNILVSIQDGRPSVKVIDFGIAKATASKLTEKTIFTAHKQLIGTPQYMSPEQAEGSLDIDTRTDVYSLGVVLYELLTGSTPFTGETLRSAAYAEIQRIIREVDPPKPSTRLSHSGDLASVAARRHVEPGKLGPMIRGELDWIVMKALEKDRTRRYDSPSSLARDVERHLDDEPVEACPPSAGYLMGKFVRRHRRLLVTAAAFAALLMAATAVSAWEAVRATRAEAGAQRDRDEALLQSYVANIAAAQANLQADQIASARRRLALAPEMLRGWEWSYLNAQCDHSIAVLRGHEDLVASVAYSPDGTRLASASQDATVRLWDAETGRQLAILRGHDAYVTSVAFSPDGRRLASASHDGTVRLWDVAGGQTLGVLTGHEDPRLHTVAFSPDGTRLASSSRDGSVRIWDAATYQELAVLRGHEEAAAGVAFSPDGAQIASASRDRTVRIWDAGTGRPLRVLRCPGMVFAVAYSPDGTRIAAGGAGTDGSVHLFNTSTGEQVLVLREHEGWVVSVSFSPDGRRLATASADATIRLFDTTTGEQLGSLHGHEDGLFWVAFSPDGTRLASASLDRTVRLWEAVDIDRSVLRGPEGAAALVRFSPDGASLTSPCTDGTIRVWDLASGRQRSVRQVPNFEATAYAMSADGTRLAAGASDHAVHLWDITGDREVALLRGHEDQINAVQFSPDGARVASTSSDRTIRLWDASTGAELAVLRGHDDAVIGIAFSPDGRMIASASVDKTARLWNVATGASIATFGGHDDRVYSVAFSPDGSLLATGSFDATIRLWEISSGRLLGTLTGHQGMVFSITFSPDGTRLASASADRTVRLWDPSTGQELLVLRGHQGPITMAAFSPDGTRLASSAADHTVRIWDSVAFRGRSMQGR